MRLRREREKALDETILERMEADDGDASASGEEVRDSGQRERQFRELRVHRNPKGLERARGRILTPITPRPRAGGLRDDRGELARRHDRSALASLRNRSCNRLSKAFFTIIANDPRQFANGCAREELRRRLATRRIHPHVERALEAKREAALRAVDLRRRHAEVEKRAVDRLDAKRREDLRNFREPAAAKREAGIAKGRCRGFGRRVAIDGDNAALWAEAGQEGARVPPAAERRVDINPVRARRKPRDRFAEQDRQVAGVRGRAHPPLKGSSPLTRTAVRPGS